MRARRGLALCAAFAACATVAGTLVVGVHRARRRSAQSRAAHAQTSALVRSGRHVERDEPATTAWPAPASPLATRGARLAETHTIVLDPGHGARDNRGNIGGFCLPEQDVMMDLAVDVAARLEERWNVRTILAREPGATVDYAARLRLAETSGAEAFVSLHSDVRGHIDRWAPSPGLDCACAEDSPGFAILYSDEGAALVAARRTLARAIAARMSEAGFLAYDGAEYAGFYEADRDPGVFIDRHAPGQRIFVLRRAAMPSVIIETHNALDPAEAARWLEPETVDAFAAAIAAALHEVWGAPTGGGAVRAARAGRDGVSDAAALQSTTTVD